MRVDAGIGALLCIGRDNWAAAQGLQRKGCNARAATQGLQRKGCNEKSAASGPPFGSASTW